MCEFISYIEYNGEIFFLDDNKLNTKEGRELLKPDFKDDILGHGAIRHYYTELGTRGVYHECEDFSHPENFPPQIVSAIKKGLFVNFGICPQILNNPSWAEYKKIQGIALAEYKKIIGIAFWKIARLKKNRVSDWK
jgi:hypothetical protein